MKKTTKATLAVCAGAVIVCAAFMPGRAEPKKDVSDPVLNEIIQNFGPRMPRFIDKHGKDVFVTDAPVTRGGLMFALYEYDKSLKLPKKDYVTRQEFEELNSRLNALENSPEAKKREPGGESGSAPIDITQIINDLMPNMPVLLDGSLYNSKVFMSLKSEVANSTPQGSEQIKTDLEQTRYELSELTRKVDMLAKAPPSHEADKSSNQQASAYLKNDLTLTRSELAKLEKRVNNIENRKESARASQPASGAEDIKSYASVLAKISMGLSMVAALFIAR